MPSNGIWCCELWFNKKKYTYVRQLYAQYIHGLVNIVNY